MANLTPAQRATADAYAHVFNGDKAAQLVLDDLTVFANALPESQQAGGAKLLLHILAQRSRLRREKVRNGG